MDYESLWNEICFHINKNRNSSERDFQTAVEFLFEKLGWSAYKGEIVTRKAIPVGAAKSLKPDVIIHADGKDILVVELKKPSATMTDRNADQLISYMRQLRLDFGILLGETLQLYYESSKGNIKVRDIPFIENSDEGVKCISRLSKSGYSLDELHNYCIDSLCDIENRIEARERVSILCSEIGAEIVSDLLKKKLLEDFPDDIVLSIMDEIRICISRKGEQRAVFSNTNSSGGFISEVSSNKTAEVEAYIIEKINMAHLQGDSSIRIRSGQIQNELGMNNRVVIVCNAMNKLARQIPHKVISTTESGFSTTIEIEYLLTEDYITSSRLCEILSQTSLVGDVDKATAPTEVSISKRDAIGLCVANGITTGRSLTFSSLNKTGATYWANPNINLLESDWWLLLNDNRKKELHIFYVPANSIPKNQVVPRSDMPHLIDLQIKYGNNLFECQRSKIKFESWFVKTISY